VVVCRPILAGHENVLTNVCVIYGVILMHGCSLATLQAEFERVITHIHIFDTTNVSFPKTSVGDVTFS